jgi:hypothetical protein
MAAFVWGAGGSQMTPEEIAAQRKVAQAMMAQGTDASPVQSWSQGAARVAQAIFGGMQAHDANEAAKANAASEAALIGSLVGGTPAPVVPAAAPAPAAPAAPGNAASAIASIESGGKYDLLGPVTKTGDRAYGKYQVMGANVPVWTKAYAGREMTPQEFLASREAQDAVFKGQFGQYAQKYGPEGAAKAWFAGEKGMNNPNARDQLGTTVQSYADRFSKAYGGAPYQVAGPAVAAPAAPAPTEAAAVAPPAVQPAAAAPAASGVNPRVLSALASPYVSDGTKKVLGIMLQNQLSSEGVTTADAGNKIIVMDKRGNVVRELAKGEPNKGPEYGVIGKDQFGNEQYGWRDPRSQTVTPFNPQGATAGQPVTVPGPDGKPIAVPTNADPKVYREGASKAGIANALPASFDDSTKLRHEVSQLPAYKNLAQAAPIYKSMVETAGTNSKASDLNLVYGLGKIMDPNSVVREGEMVMVKNTASLPDWLVGAANSLNGGAALTPETRAAILKEAHNRITSYKTMYDQDASHYRGIAERNRMNPSDVIQDFGEFKPYEPAKPGAPVVVDGYTIKAK